MKVNDIVEYKKKDSSVYGYTYVITNIKQVSQRLFCSITQIDTITHKITKYSRFAYDDELIVIGNFELQNEKNTTNKIAAEMIRKLFE